jgi:hypothetical protein
MSSVLLGTALNGLFPLWDEIFSSYTLLVGRLILELFPWFLKLKYLNPFFLNPELFFFF